MPTAAEVCDQLTGPGGIGKPKGIMSTHRNMIANLQNTIYSTAAAGTGDIGYVDDEGFVFITDRKKDMIIRGGENIYCVEIEERLVQHDAIADAAVIASGRLLENVLRGEGVVSFEETM